MEQIEVQINKKQKSGSKAESQQRSPSVKTPVNSKQGEQKSVRRVILKKKEDKNNNASPMRVEASNLIENSKCTPKVIPSALGSCKISEVDLEQNHRPEYVEQVDNSLTKEFDNIEVDVQIHANPSDLAEFDNFDHLNDNNETDDDELVQNVDSEIDFRTRPGIHISDSADELQAKEYITSNPALQRLLQRMVDDKFKAKELENKSKDPQPQPQPQIEEPKPGTSQESGDSEKDRLDAAKERANQMILEAERYRASIEKPQGKQPEISDDDFFHLTCHVDNTIRSKIEKGEFVELEKLLPNDRMGSQHKSDNRLDLVHRDGYAFVVPHVKENKITNVRRWEQVFRIYAAIYSGSNPHRSTEIWQYVYIINTAATTYHWDNVAAYDYTFRQLMASAPSRSWAKIYNQMWNLSMKDPLPRTHHPTAGYQSNVQGKNNGQQQHGQPKKSKNCWKFNKDMCSDASCPYPHRCSYCDKPGHGKFNCYSRNKGDRRNSGASSSGANVKNEKPLDKLDSMN